VWKSHPAQELKPVEQASVAGQEWQDLHNWKVVLRAPLHQQLKRVSVSRASGVDVTWVTMAPAAHDTTPAAVQVLAKTGPAHC
jgi:hypothetical protein